MMKKKSSLRGVVVEELQVHSDSRGWLVEVFRKDEIRKDIMPVMGYVSMTRPGVARGPHEHKKQTDYFCFLGTSSFRLYLWDNRKGSSARGKKEIIRINKGRVIKVVIPPGVIHGYKNVGRTGGLVVNIPNKLYAGHMRRTKVDEIRYENKNRGPFKI